MLTTTGPPDFLGQENSVVNTSFRNSASWKFPNASSTGKDPGMSCSTESWAPLFRSIAAQLSWPQTDPPPPLPGTFIHIMRNRRMQFCNCSFSLHWPSKAPRHSMRVWSSVFHCLPLPPGPEVAPGSLAQSGSTWLHSTSVGFVPSPWGPAVHSRWIGQQRTGVGDLTTRLKVALMCFCGSGFFPRGLVDVQVHHP